MSNILKPCSIDEFFGQKEIINKLKVYIYSAKKRKDILDHIMLYGPPGCGKTTLANVISLEMKSKLIEVSAPSISNLSEMVEIISQIKENDILFIDEIHGLKKEIEETLYSVLENFKLNISYKNDEKTKILSIDIPHFTLIGASTNIAKLSKPLRDRFGIIFKFEYYTDDELSSIIEMNKTKLGMIFSSSESSLLIAKRSRRTPRIANNILKRLLDYKIYYSLKIIDKKKILDFFEFIDIDEYGLSKNDYEIIRIFYVYFKNTAVSIETIASYLNENPHDIKQMNEPHLLNLGIIEKTKLGRKITIFGIKVYENYLSRKLVNK